MSNANPLRVYDDVVDAIEWSPLVRINSICSDCECEVYAKCEFLNPGGSVKDRIGRRMVEEGLRLGIVKKGDAVIEPTSGNTGIGLAMASVARGLEAHIVMPHKMSREKGAALHALGAHVVRTPTEASFDDDDSHIEIARRMEKEMANGKILDQYTNPANPDAHYEHTGAEIVSQMGGKIDVFVAGAGTGGTVTGIARRFKEDVPQCRIVCVDPVGSILAEGKGVATGGYQVEGTGYDFIPDVLDRSVVDEWYKSTDQETFTYARRLIREEGLLVGGSSGASMAAAHKVAKTLKKGDRLVVLFADSIRNYLFKFADDRWMRDYGFMAPIDRFGGKTVEACTLEVVPVLSAAATIADAVEAMGDHPAIAVEAKRGLLSVVSPGSLLSYVCAGGSDADLAHEAVMGDFRWMTPDTSLAVAANAVARLGFVLVVTRGEGGAMSCEGVLTQGAVLQQKVN